MDMVVECHNHHLCHKPGVVIGLYFEIKVT